MKPHEALVEWFRLAEEAGTPGISFTVGLILALEHPEYARAIVVEIPPSYRAIAETNLDRLVAMTPILREPQGERVAG